MLTFQIHWNDKAQNFENSRTLQLSFRRKNRLKLMPLVDHINSCDIHISSIHQSVKILPNSLGGFWRPKKKNPTFWRGSVSRSSIASSLGSIIDLKLHGRISFTFEVVRVHQRKKIPWKTRPNLKTQILNVWRIYLQKRGLHFFEGCKKVDPFTHKLPKCR